MIFAQVNWNIVLISVGNNYSLWKTLLISELYVLNVWIDVYAVLKIFESFFF